MVQNKLHFAITGKTAAEIIYSRADKSKDFMGLTSWKNSPEGKILKSDVSIAKNYFLPTPRFQRGVNGLSFVTTAIH